MSNRASTPKATAPRTKAGKMALSNLGTSIPSIGGDCPARQEKGRQRHHRHLGHVREHSQEPVEHLIVVHDDRRSPNVTDTRVAMNQDQGRVMTPVAKNANMTFRVSQTSSLRASP